MGRGRAKAKQTKVARALKYQTPDMNLDRLKADLGVSEDDEATTSETEDVDDEYDDPYAVEDDEDDERSSPYR